MNHKNENTEYWHSILAILCFENREMEIKEICALSVSNSGIEISFTDFSAAIEKLDKMKYVSISRPNSISFYRCTDKGKRFYCGMKERVMNRTRRTLEIRA